MEVKHGRNDGWLAGCRDRCCATAHRRWKRNRAMLADLRGEPRRVRVPLEPTKNKILNLLNRGYTIPQISKASGVPNKTLHSILDRGTRYVFSDTADKLKKLKVNFVPVKEDVTLEDQYVSSVGTVRRLRALHWMGISAKEISDQCGGNYQQLERILSRNPDQVKKKTHEAVRRAYEYLVARDVPDNNRQTRSRRRKKAERLGWHPPGLWRNIDNPREDPDNFKRS